MSTTTFATAREITPDFAATIGRDPALDRQFCEAAAQVLQQRMKVQIGTTVDVVFEEPGVLPRSEGKFKRVYDHR